jgi:GH15 family glucan-1,4-alpha-glucosidase
MTDPAGPRTVATDAPRLTALARSSHEVITRHQHVGGAYPASPTFSAYRGYAWLRDGAFTAEGVSRYGDVVSANRFHDWASGVLTAQTGLVGTLRDAVRHGREIPADLMLPTRFTLDGEIGTDPWWDFQTDGYGTWLWSVVTHARRHGLALSAWRTGIEVAVDYLTTFWDHPCYDWWEENVDHRHVSTLGAIYSGLSESAHSGILDPARRSIADRTARAVRHRVLTEGTATAADGSVYLAKWLGSTEVDASVAACVVPFGLVAPTDPIGRATIDAIARELDVDGGVHRYRADVFYGGGQWPLLSCLLGWNRTGDTDPAEGLRYLTWAGDHATDDGELPEQVPDHLLHPDHRDAWIDRWGTVATPLLWSHGMFLILADELGLLTNGRTR